MGNRSIYYLYIQFGDSKQKEGLARIEKFHRKNFNKFNMRVLIVDNKYDRKNIFIEYTNDIVKIAGDNENREFSAYDLAVRSAKHLFNVHEEDVVIIANDTFFTHYGDEYLEKFNKKRIRACIKENAILGHIDKFPKDVTLFDLSFQEWIRTSFFLTKFSVLNKIGPLAIPWNDQLLFSGVTKPFFSPQAALSENYKKYLSYWLFDFENLVSDFPYEWHSKKPLNEQNVGEFRGKVRSILAEHYFSARAQRLGIPLLSL
ncbi:MAG TPA: hypothetical protein VIG33_02180 [Pseudobdellovibrionaceae bacterium]